MAQEEIYGIIYKATNMVNNKVYIGQTIRGLGRRKTDHIAESKRKSKHNNYFHHAIKCYGETAFVWEQIDIAYSKEELNNKEILHINNHDSTNISKGYNSAAGGLGGNKFVNKTPEQMAEIAKKISAAGTGRRHTPETIQKLKNRVITDEQRRHISEAQKGRTFTNETKQKMSESTKIKIFTQEHRKHIGDASRGRTMSDFVKRRITEAVSKAIIATEISTDKEIEYKSATEAVEQLNLNSSAITDVIKGRQKTAKGYHFRFKGEPSLTSEELTCLQPEYIFRTAIIETKQKPIRATDKSSGKVYSYDSLTSAFLELGIPISSISFAIRKHNGTYKNWFFERI